MTDREKIDLLCEFAEKAQIAVDTLHQATLCNWKPSEETVRRVMDELADCNLWQALADERQEAAG